MPKEFSFFELNEDAKRTLCSLPYSVSVTKNPDEEKSEQIIKRQEKFITLPEPIKDKLVSNSTSQKIQTISQNFDLELLQMADISRAIRSYYFGELKLSDFPSTLSKEMEVDNTTAQKISDLVIQKIINDNTQEKTYEAQMEKLPISAAIEKYPEIEEQLITSTHIRLKTIPEPVRPSIKNWLADYTFTIGITNHDPIIRGNYLFKNENARGLSATDREKLTTIIKSFEEKAPVTINSNTKQVIFSSPERKEIAKNPLVDLSNVTLDSEPAEIRRGQENYTQQRSAQSKIKEEIVKEPQLEKMPFETALKKYPELEEQLITSEKILLKTSSKPVQPSIKNWLADYTFTVGSNNHDSLVRENYLLKNENASILSIIEQKKLAEFISSFEEKTPLTIDTNNKQIIFRPSKEIISSQNPLIKISSDTQTAQESYSKQKISLSQKEAQPDPDRISAWRKNLFQKEAPKKETGDDNVRFSSPQKFSTEKPVELSRPAYPLNPNRALVAKTNSSTPRPLPKNVVDLREE